MKVLFFLILALSIKLLAVTDKNIDIQKLENQKAFISRMNQCMDSDQLGQFIKKALQNTTDQEKKSKYAAILEELIKYNPSCFIASVNKLDNQNCKEIEELYLEEPHFYPREDLKASLKQTKDYSKSCLAS
ncbi:MAG: hypothetical protein EXR41_03795 [Candidatus Methylopumilus sp.]|nr:hypothetical protein [Candidatus Methylopumilus sp.]